MCERYIGGKKFIAFTNTPTSQMFYKFLEKMKWKKEERKRRGQNKGKEKLKKKKVRNATRTHP